MKFETVIAHFKADTEKSQERGYRITKYSDETKQAVLTYHYTSGKRLHAIAVMIVNTLALNLSTATLASTLNKWKRQLGMQQTAYRYGYTTRNDVRTRCLAIQECIEQGKSQSEIAQKYHVSQKTISNWMSLYRDTYKEYIEQLPDGVPYIVAERKHIYGNANITKVRKLLQRNLVKVEKMIQEMHNISSLKQVKEEIEDKLQKVETYAELRAELGFND